VRQAARFTEDAILGGRLRLRQPHAGHRVGHDAVLLAAACPALARERVADLGAGVGAAGLAVALRVADVAVVLVEMDEQLAVLARENARLNDLEDRVSVLQLDVAEPAKAFAAAGLQPETVMRVLLNPPFNDPRRQRSSPDPIRRLAHSATPGGLPIWMETAKRILRPHGTVTLIWRADALDEVLRALEAFGAVSVLPIHPRPGQAAIRVLVRATKSSRAPLTLLPGFFLNDASGHTSTEAEPVLRGAATLPLAEL
jgi:tRNA1(Val) A37 N6-methylase TrmN6